MPSNDKLFAELIGTFALVAAVLGSAIISFGALGGGSGILGVAFAVGLAVMVMAYAVGPISGGAFNPAVAIGLAVMGVLKWADIWIHLAGEVAGAVLAVAAFKIAVKDQG